MKYKLISLNYKYNELEPYIDAQTMEIHHSKHHQTYVDKLNETLDKFPALTASLEELLSGKVSLPEEAKTPIINFGGGVYNHDFFFNLLSPQKIQPSAKLLEHINKEFTSLENFKDKFLESAAKVFGSGWCYLVKDKDHLKIVQTTNQNTPIIDGLTPVLSVDVWEHAYYLKYQNRRADYLKAWWEVINWPKVEENMLRS